MSSYFVKDCSTAIIHGKVFYVTKYGFSYQPKLVGMILKKIKENESQGERVYLGSCYTSLIKLFSKDVEILVVNLKKKNSSITLGPRYAKKRISSKHYSKESYEVKR